MNWTTVVFLALGAVFGVMGNLGVLIFPVLVACLFAAGWSPMSGKIAVIALFFFITNPISSHIIARYAWERELVPWRRSYAKRQALHRQNDD